MCIGTGKFIMNPDFDHTEKCDFTDQIGNLFADSVKVHCRSDVPIGAYVSGVARFQHDCINARKRPDADAAPGFYRKVQR